MDSLIFKVITQNYYFSFNIKYTRIFNLNLDTDFTKTKFNNYITKIFIKSYIILCALLTCSFTHNCAVSRN